MEKEREGGREGRMEKEREGGFGQLPVLPANRHKLVM